MKLKLGIIGTGNMAEALAAGILRQKILQGCQIVGFDIRRGRLSAMKKKYGIKIGSAYRDLTDQCDVLLLATKPQQFPDLLRQISPLVTQKHLLLSIAAGIDTSFIQKKLARRARVVRLMPNTPALIGWGATVFFANSSCRPADRRFVQKIFGAVGIVFEVKREGLLDAVTALSGSGPAFFYQFMAELAKGGIRGGLSRKQALALAVQTAAGAALMIQKTGFTPEELTAKVASKGGTTEAGLKILKRRRFGNIVGACVSAAYRRAKELRNS